MRRLGFVTTWFLATTTVCAAATGFATLGCSAADDETSAGAGPESLAERDEALGTSDVCSGLRWVGVYEQGGSCPQAGSGWSGGRLIGDPAAPPVLRRYCAYEWVVAGPPDLAKLPKKTIADQTWLPPAWLDRDCAALAQQSPLTKADQVDAIVAPTLAAAHATQIESPAAPVAPGGGTVAVAVVDAWPDTSRVGRSTHGFGMAAIVEAVSCGNLAYGASCPIITFPQLALDRFDAAGHRDLVHGGSYGFQSTLATAIYQAVAAPTAGRKILNLSVAWDGRYNDSTVAPGSFSKAVAAVVDALEYAACQGVLVITAAGNVTGATAADTGPLYPAAWEQQLAPACTGVTRPLVYSAGGVDGRDEPLANARPGARPLLAAPGFVVPGNKTVAGVPVAVGPFTGSSVAAATLTAAAALVWQRQQNLRPDEVVGIVRNAGHALTDPADYCLAPPCGNIRRISICESLAAAGAPVTCGAVTIAAGAGSNPTYDAATLAALTAVGPAAADGTALLSPFKPAPCKKSTLSSGAGPNGPLEACPGQILPTDVLFPSVDPQPEPNPCPSCTVASSQLELSIDASLSSPVVPQTLTYSKRGVVVLRYDLASAVDVNGVRLGAGLAPGSYTRVTLPTRTIVYGVDFDAAQIEWPRTTTYTASPLVVLQ